MINDPSYHLPRENLIVTILKISLLRFSNRINQLIFVKINNLLERRKVRPEGNEFRQIQNGTAEQYSKTEQNDCRTYRHVNKSVNVEEKYSEPNDHILCLQRSNSHHRMSSKRVVGGGRGRNNTHLKWWHSGIVSAKCSAEVRALQCHFLGVWVKTSQPLTYFTRSSISCLCDPPKNGSTIATTDEFFSSSAIFSIVVNYSEISKKRWYLLSIKQIFVSLVSSNWTHIFRI